MRCDDMQELISPYLDGELGLLTSVEVERHLQDCAICAQECENQRALSAALRNGGLYYKLPARLSERVQSAARRDARGQTYAPRLAWRWLGVVGATAALLIAGIFAARSIPPRKGDDARPQEVVAGHIRSLMASHLTDVP